MATSNAYKLLILAGDGVGPEVMAEARRVADWFRDKRKAPIQLDERAFGMTSWEKHGTLMPDETWERIKEADAILFGAVGTLAQQGRITDEERKKGGLLRMRKELDVFANLRPVKTDPALAAASTLKPEVIEGVDLVFVRELTAGMYFGEPRGVEVMANGKRRGVNTHTYTEDEIARVVRAAFDLARTRRNLVHSVDKGNVMEAGRLWRDVATEVHKAEYADVKLEHMLADNCAMQLVRNPKQFDVIVTDNLFGDVLSDCAAMIVGSLGMMPSAALSAKGPDGRRKALYEPIHGSAPDIAGQGIANPLAAIMSFSLCLRETLGLPEESARLDRAIAAALAGGARTADIAPRGAKTASTRQMGDAVLAALDKGA